MQTRTEEATVRRHEADGVRQIGGPHERIVPYARFADVRRVLDDGDIRHEPILQENEAYVLSSKVSIPVVILCARLVTGAV